MDTLTAIYIVLGQLQGTPYTHGFGPGGTDCSGLASVVANVSTGRDPFAARFNTGNEHAALAALGFQDGVQPGAVVIGFNAGHTAVTLPDGTPVASGEGGGVRIGGGGAYQPQFTHHMSLPTPEVVPALIDLSGPPPEAPADGGEYMPDFIPDEEQP